MELKETSFFDVWPEEWLRKWLTVPVHNLFINCVYFSGKNKV